MKKFKVLTALAACVAMLSFTSCNTDSESSALTPEQQSYCQTAMQGSHHGKLFYPHKNEADLNNQLDSIEGVSWYNTARDSSMTLTNFPISIIAEHINNEELKEAVAQAAPQTLNFKTVVYTQPATSFYYLVYPYTITTNLTYGGETHKVQFVFASSYNSIGYFSTTGNVSQNQFYLYTIYVDDKQTGYLQNSTTTSYTYVPFLLSSI